MGETSEENNVGTVRRVFGEKILEFGCGNGVMGAHYAKGNTVVGIDPDGQVLRDNPYEDVEQICGDINILSKYENETFDVILCHNVLEYAVERAEIMKEFQRLLSGNGLLSVYLVKWRRGCG